MARWRWNEGSRRERRVGGASASLPAPLQGASSGSDVEECDMGANGHDLDFLTVLDGAPPHAVIATHLAPHLHCHHCSLLPCRRGRDPPHSLSAPLLIVLRAATQGMTSLEQPREEEAVGAGAGLVATTLPPPPPPPPSPLHPVSYQEPPLRRTVEGQNPAVRPPPAGAGLRPALTGRRAVARSGGAGGPQGGGGRDGGRRAAARDGGP